MHALLLLMFAAAALRLPEHAWKVLMVDTLLGAAAFVWSRIR